MNPTIPNDRDGFTDLKLFISSAINGAINDLRAEMTRRFDESDTKLAVFEAHVDRRFAAVDRRFDEVYDRFDSIDRRLDENDLKQDGILTAIHERFIDLETPAATHTV